MRSRFYLLTVLSDLKVLSNTKRYKIFYEIKQFRQCSSSFTKRHSYTPLHIRITKYERLIVLSFIVAVVLRPMSSWLRKYCISARINLVESRFNFKIEKVPVEPREKIRDDVFNRVLLWFTQLDKMASRSNWTLLFTCQFGPHYIVRRYSLVVKNFAENCEDEKEEALSFFFYAWKSSSFFKAAASYERYTVI